MFCFFFYSLFSVDSGSEGGDIDSFDNGEWFLFFLSAFFFFSYNNMYVLK